MEPDPLACPEGKREMMRRDEVLVVPKHGVQYVICENYFYKSDAYYRILTNEMNGIATSPSSRELLEAFVVPICLEKAEKAGIDACSWEISYGYTPIPAIAYSLNYFADPAEYSILRDEEVAREVVKHITNSGKYPFCYQPLQESAEVETAVSVFGQTVQEDQNLRELAAKVYRIFRIPLVNIVMVRGSGRLLLSSLSSVRYSKLSREELELLGQAAKGEVPWGA